MTKLKALLTTTLLTLSTCGAQPSYADEVYYNEVTVQDRQYGGWVLTYQNGLTSPNSPQVTSDQHSGIHWLITRTYNKPCTSGFEPPEVCADTIKVVPPHGFIAIPSEVLVNEGGSVEILVVSEVIG